MRILPVKREDSVCSLTREQKEGDKKKVVLITGASSGFGRATACHLAERGYWVFGTSRVPESVELPATAAWKGKLKIIQMNVGFENSVRHAIDSIMRRAGRLDVVVNNAGIGIAGSIEDTTVEEAKAQFETNFFGVHQVCRLVLPIMREQGKGLIINISSLGGLVGLPFQAFYSASKFAVEGFTEALRIEVKPFGIKVVLIEPGDFHTPFTVHRRVVGNSHGNSVYQERFERALKAQEDSERKGGPPELVARLVERIITKGSPKLRYKVGPSSTLVGLKKFVPQRVVEFAVRSAYGL